jgi:hypothetical protein
MSEFVAGNSELENGEVIQAAEQPAPMADSVGDFEDENVPDPATVITIRTSSGDTRYVPVPEGHTITAGEAFMLSGLPVTGNGGFQIYLNGAIIKVTDIVPVGSTLTVVGSVKGGSR